jgi:phosphohistidine phosphatase
MILYILRHASAGTRRPNPLVDRKRGLDREGKQQCLLVGSFLNAVGVNFDAILSSPLKRSLQTASLVATEIGFDQKITADPSLEPAGRLVDFEALLARYMHLENVLVVGHNPNLPIFLGSLLAAGGSRASIRLRKGAIARIDCTRLPGTLHWLVDPRILRGIYARATKRSRPKTSRK